MSNMHRPRVVVVTGETGLSSVFEQRCERLMEQGYEMRACSCDDSLRAVMVKPVTPAQQLENDQMMADYLDKVHSRLSMRW